MDERRTIERLKRGDLCELEALASRCQARAFQAVHLIVRDRALVENNNV